MPGFEELDPLTSLAVQMKSGEGPTVLNNLLTVGAADDTARLEAWNHGADFMKAQQGCISTQVHKGIAGRSTFANYAIWEDVESFRNAFTHPEFQRRIVDYPPRAVVRSHLFKKLIAKNHCIN